jgi:hypothetical protein
VFGNHQHLEKKLRERGKSAPAKILAVKPTRMSVSHGDPRHAELVVRLSLRLRPPGEAAFDAEVTAREGPLYWDYTTGDMVIALYDPADHDCVCVDTEATEAARKAKRDKAAAKKVKAGTEAPGKAPAKDPAAADLPQRRKARQPAGPGIPPSPAHRSSAAPAQASC